MLRISIFLVLLLSAVFGYTPFAIIHIGPHKTATTYIQTLLFYLKEALATERIVAIQNEDYVNDYFSPPTNVVFLGHALAAAQSIHKHPTLSSFKNLMTTHLQNNRSVIMSSESFDLIGVKVGLLAELVHGFRPIIVITARNWMSMLLSTYYQECRFLNGVIKRCQNIPEGEEVSLRSYITHNSRLATNSSILLHERSGAHLAERYARHFGALSIRILDFDGLTASGVSVADAFLGLLDGLVSDKFHKVAKNVIAGQSPTNTAVPLDYTQILRSAKHRKLVPPECDNFKTNEPWRPIVDEDNPLPKRCLDEETTQLLMDVSLGQDAKLRKKWGSVIVGASPVAAIAAMQKAVSSDNRMCWVDEQKFFASPFWLKWLEQEVKARC